jgi:leucyl/phenylalanyl-tRNA---protein transferase
MTEVTLNIDEILSSARQIFPDPETADSEGFLASGGNLSTDMLIMAYCIGVFPWFNPGDPILWWSPDPRMIFLPGQMKISKSLRKTINSGIFRVSFDTRFNTVIEKCSGVKRPGQRGTWITKEMIAAYKKLHEQGIAHSIEVWYETELVGGLYGLSIGHAFFGESMFHTKTDASKVAYYHLSEFLKKTGFDFIDGQVPNPHLASLGAFEIPRNQFLSLLTKSIHSNTLLGPWTGMETQT